VGHESQAQLLQVVYAHGPAGRFPSRLHGRQEQTNERANDGDDNEEFHQGKRSFGPMIGSRP
jgi:hypothetical protein